MTDQTHDQQHRLLTDGGTVLACPGCDSAAIRSRNTSGAESPNAETAPAYLCTDCGDEFDDVVERAPQAACGLPGLAGTLDQTDPDLVTDGGCE